MTDIEQPSTDSAAAAGSGHRLTKFVALLKHNLEGPIVRNAISLYGTTIVTSFLGFFYWFIAARLATTRAVGIASAVQSAAQLISLVCVLGLSTLLISELSIDRTHARTLMITASAGVGAFALIVSTVVGFGFHSFSSDISKGVEGPAGIVIFVLLSSLTTILLVLDDACIGLLRGDLQLRRNTVFAVSKLVLLPILILFWATSSGIELVLAWLAGLGISLLFMAYELLNLTKGQSSRLDFRRIFEKRTLMFRHHWLNLSVQAPRLILPILVAVIVSPQANAAFTATWLVVGFVQIIPSLLSTVLFALAPGDEEALHRECRKTMRISLVVSVVSAPFFFIFSGLILRVFGPQYAVAGTTMGILGLATYPGAIKSHYVAISRVRGKMQQAVFLTIIGVTLEVGFSAAGGALWGLNGVALGLLVGLVVEAFVYAPTVFGVLIEGRASRTISTEHVANIEEEATSPDRNMQ